VATSDHNEANSNNGIAVGKQLTEIIGVIDHYNEGNCYYSGGAFAL